MPWEVEGADAARIAAVFPSFRDFVDLALFDPHCGYYSTGKVRFGYGGHYDTFPLALSPFFGRMLAQYGFRFWRRAGEPERFEICELGAGNGQLCLDVLVTVAEQARRGRGWGRFARALRYRIIERSPALVRRQQAQLGALRRQVRWTAADLGERALRRMPLAPCGVVFANEVLDCLSHHKIVSRHDKIPGVVFVVPVVRSGAEPDGVPLVAGLRADQRAVARQYLSPLLAAAHGRERVSFEEVVLPLDVVPGLEEFLRRNYPELFSARRFRPYFACPTMESLVCNVAGLYDACDILWIDYGDTREFHLGTPPGQRLFAGPPGSGASVYRAPGTEDITFMVDFSVLAEAAERAGLRVTFFGPQAELARRSGVVLGDGAVDQIVQYRMLGWMLALVGIGPERDWFHTGLTWGQRKTSRMSVRADTRRSMAEFLGQRRSNFKLMIMRP
jgi:SAM-dependent MidA family methyltransferase